MGMYLNPGNDAFQALDNYEYVDKSGTTRPRTRLRGSCPCPLSIGWLHLRGMADCFRHGEFRRLGEKDSSLLPNSQTPSSESNVGIGGLLSFRGVSRLWRCMA